MFKRVFCFRGVMSEIPTNKSNRLITVLLVLVIVCAVGVLVYTNLPPNNTTPTPTGGTNETRVPIMTIRYNTEEKNYTFAEIQAFTVYTGKGGYHKNFAGPGSIQQVGNYAGVAITTLINQLDNLPQNYSINVTSSDGYYMVYNHSVILGNLAIYDPQNESNIDPIGNGSLTMILAYKYEGQYLNESKDGKLKIAFLNDEGSITASSLWSKFVVSIDVIAE